jgi:hypothetical protein
MLTVTPKYHCVVVDEGDTALWNPRIQVEEGSFDLHVGGGQPAFTKGVLSTTVRVTKTGLLDTQWRCAADNV